MRLVFVGSTKFGISCLKQCFKIQGLNVVGIVTAPKNFAISYSSKKVNNVLHEDVS